MIIRKGIVRKGLLSTTAMLLFVAFACVSQTAQTALSQTALAQTALAQTEKLGIVQYTPLPGWKKTVSENMVGFSELNQSSGRFCIITLYGANASKGSPEADFSFEWNNLVVKTLAGEASPKTQMQSADGWTITASATSVEAAGAKSVAFLTVITGYGKRVSVLAVFNDQSYMVQLERFVAGLEVDKTAPPSTSTSTSPAPTSPAPAPVPDQPGKFGAMIYQAPAGWTEQVFPDGVVFKPADLPAGEQLAIQIMQPLNFSGTLEQALQQSYDEAATMYKASKMHFAGGANYQGPPAQKSFNGWDYIRGKGGVQVENGTPYKTELGLELFVVKVNNRFERVAILDSRKNCGLSRYYSSDRLSYRDGIENLLYSLQFTDFNASEMKPGSAAGVGIVGVWQGISLTVGAPSVGAPVGVRYKAFSPIFLTNGQAYFGPKFPTPGLDEFDTRIPAELYRRDWGTYTFSNGRGVLKMPYENIPLRMEGNRLIITPMRTDHAFSKLGPVDGATFAGRYALSEVNGKIPTITFTADGRFTDNGAVKVLYHEYIDCLNPALTPGSGTYEVKDYSVTFTYTDGRKIRIAFLGVGYSKNDPSPAKLSMSYNEDPMTRQ